MSYTPEQLARIKANREAREAKASETAGKLAPEVKAEAIRLVNVAEESGKVEDEIAALTYGLEALSALTAKVEEAAEPEHAPEEPAPILNEAEKESDFAARLAAILPDDDEPEEGSREALRAEFEASK